MLRTPAARRARIRRPRLHRLDVDGRGGEDAAARRRRRARRSRRRRSGAALAGSDRRVQGHEGGDGRGRISEARLDESVERVLRAKASVGLHLRARSTSTPCRAASAAARIRRSRRRRSPRSITLVKDERQQVPLTVPRDTAVLYLSVLDYPSGWQIAAPSRTFIPELKKRWPQVTAIEVSDHTPLAELDARPLHRPRATAPSSCRCSCAPRPAAAGWTWRSRSSGCCGIVGRAATERTGTPMVTTFFGNPYIAACVPELPAMLLTYDFYDHGRERPPSGRSRGKRRSAASCRSRCRPPCRSGSGWNGSSLQSPVVSRLSQVGSRGQSQSPARSHQTRQGTDDSTETDDGRLTLMTDD